MKKTKLLMPIIGISALSTIAMPLAGCSCKQEESTRDVYIDTTLSDKVTVKTEKTSSGDYSVVLSCKDTTTYIPKIKSIIIGEYVLNSSEYSFELKDQTIVIKNEVVSAHTGWITVLPEQPQTIALESIKVTAPTKTEYNAGDTLDLTDMVVTGKYNNGKSETITEGYTTTPSKDDKLKTTDTEVTVTYKGLTDKFTIKVNPVALTTCIKLAATQPATMTWTKAKESKLSYSFDSINWTTATSGLAVDFGTKDDNKTLYLRGTMSNDDESQNNIKISCKDSSSPSVVLSGSLMNLLLDANDQPAKTLPNYAFCKLFDGSTALLSISETKDDLLLPAETLTTCCYQNMFSSCTGLKNTPALPAKTLTEACYYEMFASCTSLRTISSISAETLGYYSCSRMFVQCSSLVVATSKPASGEHFFKCPDTSSSTGSVSDMFKDTAGVVADPVTGGDYYCDTMPSFAETDWTTILTAIAKVEADDMSEASMKELCSLFGDTKYVSTGTTVEEHLANFIGKTHTLKINGLDHVVRIIGANHDPIVDGTGALTTKNALFTFELVTILSDASGERIESYWDEETIKNYDYTNSRLRWNLNNNGSGQKPTTKIWNTCALDMLPTEIKSNIKTVQKQVATTSSWTVNTYNDKLFPLTYKEMAQTDMTYARDEGTAYKYWEDHNDNDSRIKKDNKGNNYEYWLASPIVNWDQYAWAVYNSGKIGMSYNLDSTATVSFAFCI